MRKIKSAILALLCAVTAIAVFGAVKTIANADEEIKYTYVDTYVDGVVKGSSDRWGFVVNGSDYEGQSNYNNGKVYTNINGLNTLTKIKIDGEAIAETAWNGETNDPYLNLWTKAPAFVFCEAAFKTASTITVEAGCEFPSYALWSGAGNTVYRTTEAVTFERHGDTWARYVNSSVDGVIRAVGFNDRFGFVVNGSDYTSQYNNSKNYTNINWLNTLTKIKIDGEAIAETAWNGDKNDPYLNLYTKAPAFVFCEAAFATASTITVEAGCEFPSYALWSGKGSVVYKTTEDVTFERRGNAYVKYENTSVVGLSVNADPSWVNYPRIELTNTDYSLSGGTYNGINAKDYTFINGLTTFSKIKIDGVAMENVFDGDVTDPYLNMFEASGNRFAFKYAGFDTATEVVIEAGCEFPSYALWSGKGSTVYRTTETYKFKKVNDGWYKVFVATFVDESGNTLGTSEFTVTDEDLVYPSFDKEEGYDYAWTGNELKEENITVTLTKTIKTFDVKIGDGEAQKCNYGAKLVKPENPEIIGEAGYEITFKGWFNGEKEWNFETDTVTGDLTLTAKFDKKAIEYKATLTFADGTKKEVAYTVENRSAKLGELNALKKQNDAQYSYSYNLPEELPLRDCEYAETRTVNKYNVTIEESTLSVEYGSKLTKPETNPVKDEDEEYTYTFKGWFNGETEWNFETDTVTGDLTLTAKFDKKAIEYKATLTFADGTKKEVAYTVENRSAKLGELNALKKQNDAQYSYSYNLPEELPLRDCEYAETRTVNKYTVTIGESTLSVEYGSKLTKPETAPVKDEDEEYTYTFKGWFNGETEWNFETDTVTGDLTLTAKFDAVKKETEGCVGSVSGLSALSAFAFVCAAVLIKKKDN